MWCVGEIGMRVSCTADRLPPVLNGMADPSITRSMPVLPNTKFTDGRSTRRRAQSAVIPALTHSPFRPYLLIVLFPLRSYLLFRDVTVIGRRNQRQSPLHFDHDDGLDAARCVRRPWLLVEGNEFVRGGSGHRSAGANRKR